MKIQHLSPWPQYICSLLHILDLIILSHWHQYRISIIWIFSVNGYRWSIQLCFGRDSMLLPYKTWQPKISVHEIYHFIALLGHDDQDTMKDYWSTNELYYAPFYLKVIKCGQFLHILRFIHFENNGSPADRKSLDCDRLWKLRRFLVTSLIYSPQCMTL
jgi:hypothetical protein